MLQYFIFKLKYNDHVDMQTLQSDPEKHLGAVRGKTTSRFSPNVFWTSALCDWMVEEEVADAFWDACWWFSSLSSPQTDSGWAWQRSETAGSSSL